MNEDNEDNKDVDLNINPNVISSEEPKPISDSEIEYAPDFTNFTDDIPKGSNIKEQPKTYNKLKISLYIIIVINIIISLISIYLFYVKLSDNMQNFEMLFIGFIILLFLISLLAIISNYLIEEKIGTLILLSIMVIYFIVLLVSMIMLIMI